MRCSDRHAPSYCGVKVGPRCGASSSFATGISGADYRASRPALILDLPSKERDVTPRSVGKRRSGSGG